MNDQVINRLKSLGYTPTESDTWALNFLLVKVENYIKNFCNTANVPEGLTNTAVDRVCGEFLNELNKTGRLTIGSLDLDMAIKSIREGDVQVDFGNNASDSDKISSLIAYLMQSGDGELICYRKMKW